METVVGVRFCRAGKIYYFSPGRDYLVNGDYVIVETTRGKEYGKVVLGPKKMKSEDIVKPLKPVIRKATERDTQINKENKIKERKAKEICEEKIRKHNLDMKLIDVEMTFDGGKYVFSFLSDNRVDFRDLVKDLVAIFKTRIELRQVGVRDQAKLLGGIAACGRVLCCHGFLEDFQPVSIKMAKHQNLSLNPVKISGICGRLMCCLKYESYDDEGIAKRVKGVEELEAQEAREANSIKE